MINSVGKLYFIFERERGDSIYQTFSSVVLITQYQPLVYWFHRSGIL